MKVVALVSGGKDSCYAMMRCIDYGHEIVALANLFPADDSVDELDSYMYQTVGHQIVVSYAECMGLPLFRRRICGSTRHQELNYKVTPGDEVEDLFTLLHEIKQQIPSITAVSSGAIASDYQRLRVENTCSRLGLVSLAYLWKQDQTILLEEMIKRGIRAITVKVATMGLVPEQHLGKELAFLHPHLLRIKELYGINVCGEGGEYETLTLDCPLFKFARIILDKFQVILHSPDSIAQVGIIHPLAFHLEYKKDVSSSCSYCEDIDICTTKFNCVKEVNGNLVGKHMMKCEFGTLNGNADNRLCMHISTIKREVFSISCWTRHSSKAPEGLQDDLSAILRRIELQLANDGFGWENVLYVHLYICNMEEFKVANDVYVKFITEKKCPLGVPSRSTIELPLAQVGLGDAFVEVIVAKDKTKNVLHVQSISCWAPSCIGPYSQATLHGGILYMAGQLGLDPPTMMLQSEGSAAQLDKALDNCEAVANYFNSSITSSAVLFVIYCSSALTPYERNAVEQKIGLLLDQQTGESGRLGSSRMFPISVYILASDLPKGALLEIKPILHIHQKGNNTARTSLVQQNYGKVGCHWGFEYSEWHDSCYQKYVNWGNICAALISITKDVAAEISSLCGQSLIDFRYHSPEQQSKHISRFCIFLLDRIISENGFSWLDLISLRIYYRTEAFSNEILSDAFSEAFDDLVTTLGNTEISGQNYSLIPVLGSGSSSVMADLVTCEVFALKS